MYGLVQISEWLWPQPELLSLLVKAKRQGKPCAPLLAIKTINPLPCVQALSSLRKYPLPLRSGREARILQYFGDHICRQLDERLERHCQAQDGTVLTGEW